MNVETNQSDKVINFDKKQKVRISLESIKILRRDIINELGAERAKGFLMRYGWNCGEEEGNKIPISLEGNSIKELKLSSFLQYSLGDIVQLKLERLEMKNSSLYMTGSWKNSFEAEEHLNLYGTSKEAVCWFLCGYLRGYLTSIFEEKVVVYEEKCFGSGDDHCYFVVKFEEEKKHEKYLKEYQQEPIAKELERTYSELHEMNDIIVESDTVQKKLTSLFFEDKDLSETIYYVAKVLDKSIIVDYRNKTIESAFKNETDEKAYRNWANKFIYNEEKRNDITTFPIRANNLNLGRMVVIGNNKMGKKDQLVINRALSVLTIQMFHQWKVTHSIWKTKEDFFNEMLNNPNKVDFKKKSHLFNFSPSTKNRVVAVQIDDHCHDETLKFLNKNYKDIDVFLKGQHIVIILSASYAEKKAEIVYEIKTLLYDHFKSTKVHIGVGRESSDLSTLIKSYHDACRISDFIQLTQHNNGISFYEDLEAIMMFLKGTDNEELIDFYKNTIGELVEYDKVNQTNFLITLKSYLDNNGNLQSTADDLHLSITGLRYRLERIEKLCNADLKKGACRFRYQLAMRIHYALQINGQES